MNPISRAPLLHILIAGVMLQSTAQALPVTIDSERYPIPGILEIPAAATASVPAVLLLHGSASQKDEVGGLYRELADVLRKSGIASLRIDFAGTGDSPVSYRRYSLSSATGDALIALRFLRAQPGVRGDAIAILGFSEGGLIAQRTVLADGDTAALATWSTVATDGAGDFRRDFDVHYAAALREGYVRFSFPWLAEPLDFDLRWFEEMREQNTLTQMQKFTKPILAIAGAADLTVPPAHSVALVARSTNRESRALVLAGANHIFNVLDSPPGSGSTSSSRQLIDETVRWLSRVLEPQAAD